MELSSVRTEKEPFFSGAVMPPEVGFSHAAGQPRREQRPVRRRVHFASAVDSCGGRCELTNCLDGAACVSCLGARIPGRSRRTEPLETGKDGGEAKRRRAELSSGDLREQDNGKNSSPPEPPRDYIHVRARRGQATDSHSLAERVRRERISERMKLLQGLVPGCNKITSRALVLDEIINYVQSLQQQVEFLSTKLAALNPQFNLAMETLLDQNIDQGDAYPRIQHECPYLDGFADAFSQVGDSWDDELQRVVQDWKKNSH